MSIDRRKILTAGGAAAAALALGKSNSPRGMRSKMGLIGLEEHVLPDVVRPDWERGWGKVTYAANNYELAPRIADMDRYGVQMMVLSLTAGGPQSESDPAMGQDMAKRANDEMARIVASRPDRYAAFGCLAMHDVDAACKEFERVVRDLGLRGVLINNYQSNGPDPESVLLYDAPRYDAFWETSQRLGSPVYLHPNWATPLRQRLVGGLRGATWEFAIETGTHALQIIRNGVFDRYPGARLILGHNGEHIVGDMWRIENWLKKNARNNKMKNPLRSYFKTNIFITTSGQFSTPALQHCIAEIGADRIMFSVDTPYEETSVGVPWFRSAEITDEQFKTIGRENAIRILKLPIH